MAQRRAQQRDRAAINDAQKSAQQRFEKDLLDRVQGKWMDEERVLLSWGGGARKLGLLSDG